MVVRFLLAKGATWNAAWKGEIPHEVILKPTIHFLLVATFRLRRWVRYRLMRLRLYRIATVCHLHRVCMELIYAPPKGPFKYIESKESFRNRAFLGNSGL